MLPPSLSHHPSRPFFLYPISTPSNSSLIFQLLFSSFQSILHFFTFNLENSIIWNKTYRKCLELWKCSSHSSNEKKNVYIACMQINRYWFMIMYLPSNILMVKGISLNADWNERMFIAYFRHTHTHNTINTRHFHSKKMQSMIFDFVQFLFVSLVHLSVCIFIIYHFSFHFMYTYT